MMIARIESAKIELANERENARAMITEALREKHNVVYPYSEPTDNGELSEENKDELLFNGYGVQYFPGGDVIPMAGFIHKVESDENDNVQVTLLTASVSGEEFILTTAYLSEVEDTEVVLRFLESFA